MRIENEADSQPHRKEERAGITQQAASLAAGHTPGGTQHLISGPIRITYLITDLKVGGVPLHLYRLATRLPAERIRVRVISLADEGPVGVMLRRAGIPVLGCGARSAGEAPALWRLWQILRADRTDILHSLLFHANVAARAVGPAAGIPPRRIICEIQTAERERAWHLWADNLTCRLCRTEVANSPSVIEHLHHRAHVPRERLTLQWGAVDVEAIESAIPVPRQELGITDDAPIILWTGRLDPVKGFEQMIGAVAQLLKQRQVWFVLAGEGPYRATLDRLIREHQIESRVRLLGERRDVPRLLKSADVFLFCSMTEGLPNALLEAMAAGVPIVATNVAGCRDLVPQEETGLLVRYGDAAGTVIGLSKLLDDLSLRTRVAQGGRSWIRQHANAEQMAARWTGFYETVHRDKRA